VEAEQNTCSKIKNSKITYQEVSTVSGIGRVPTSSVRDAVDKVAGALAEKVPGDVGAEVCAFVRR
jgi:hypothetical protein